MDRLSNPPDWRKDTVLPLHADVKAEAWAVDGACSGNPGKMEYRAVDLSTGEVVFKVGPYFGTNNIAEFLAIVHALALMQKRGIHDKVIYSDSLTARTWVKNKTCKSKLEHNTKSAYVLQLVQRAENWLRTHQTDIPILKWDTTAWGEIPADFGRK